MRLLSRIFIALAIMAPVAPASGQIYYGGGMMHGGPMRGMGGVGIGIVPGLLAPAIAAGAAHAAQPVDEPPPRYLRHPPPRKKIVHAPPERQPPRQMAKPHQPKPQLVKPQLAKPQPAAKAPVVASAVLNLPPAGETRYLAKEVLVVFRPDASERAIEALPRNEKLETAQFRDLALLKERVYRFRYFDDRPLDSVMKALARDPAVASVQAHYVYALAQDAQPVALAAPERSIEIAPVESAASPDYAAAMMHLPEAHHIATGKGVRVALIDSAIDATHPEIAGSIVASFDATGVAGNPGRHGSGMASAIAGHGQIDGGAPGAQLLVAHAFDETADGAKAVGLDLLAALDWAVAQKAQIVNMSFAGPVDPLLQQMLAAAADRKIVLIGAAGNDGPKAPPAFPGADPHVIAVSALDGQSRLYDHANRGDYVALAAPGVDVLVAAPGGAYDLTSGTSVACAEVSGIAALLLEQSPTLDGAALRRRLRDSAHALSNVPEAGAGLADAQAALGRAH